MSLDAPTQSEIRQIDPEKEELIQQIRESDRLIFETWAAQPGNNLRLDIPPDALRILIPQRVFELSEDPSAVAILPYLEDTALLRAVVYERRKYPISNAESLNAYVNEFNALNEGKSKDDRSVFPRSPEDVDEYHILFKNLISQGKLTVNDYITNFITLDTKFYGEDDVPLDVLEVGEYEDRGKLRGKGIATSFYTQLRNTAKQLGYRAIMGQNNARNVTYFTEKLGRMTLDHLPEQNRKLLHSDSSSIPASRVTIDFLYPEDKEQFSASTS